jgi:hypothetical protein
MRRSKHQRSAGRPGLVEATVVHTVRSVVCNAEERPLPGEGNAAAEDHWHGTERLGRSDSDFRGFCGFLRLGTAQA